MRKSISLTSLNQLLNPTTSNSSNSESVSKNIPLPEGRPVLLKKRSRSLKSMEKYNSETLNRGRKGIQRRGHKKIQSAMFLTIPVQQPPLELELNGNVGGFVGSLVKFEITVRESSGNPAEIHPYNIIVHIDGPLSNIKAHIIPKGVGLYQIEFVPLVAGVNLISIYNQTTLIRGGIKSVIKEGGEKAFVLHSNDIVHGYLQGHTVVPLDTSNVPYKSLLQRRIEHIDDVKNMLRELCTQTMTEYKVLILQDTVL